MNRRQFLWQTALLTTASTVGPRLWAAETGFPIVRVTEAKRRFKSAAVEKAIAQVQSSIGNKELAWMFGNCFPNTLDTTVEFEMVNGRPDMSAGHCELDATRKWISENDRGKDWPASDGDEGGSKVFGCQPHYLMADGR